MKNFMGYLTFLFLDTKQFSITSSALTVALPPVDSLTLRPAQLPMAIPSDLSDR